MACCVNIRTSIQKKLHYFIGRFPIAYRANQIVSVAYVSVRAKIQEKPHHFWVLIIHSITQGSIPIVVARGKKTLDSITI